MSLYDFYHGKTVCNFDVRRHVTQEMQSTLAGDGLNF